MIDIINLAVPFFGMIFIGLACGRYKRIPDTGLAWMNFFIIYVTLPALFYRILAQTPMQELAQIPFILATTLATFIAFSMALVIGLAARHGRLDEATIAGLSGGYGNIGYMGPGLALAALGARATAPVALIFCFDTLLLFSLVPLLMALAGTDKKRAGAIFREVGQRIATNPFIVASALGVASAAIHFQPPVALDRLLEFLQAAAAPSALFTLGVTVAMRRLERVPWEVPLLTMIKLIGHPMLVLALLTLFGPFAETWVATAVLMASLPPALNVFVFARHYDTWVPQASSTVLFGTLVSIITLPTVLWLVKTGNLPMVTMP